MVLHSSKEADIQTMEELLDRILEPGRLSFQVKLVVCCVYWDRLSWYYTYQRKLKYKPWKNYWIEF